MARNETSPLIQALRKRAPSNSIADFHPAEMPRTFELKHHEMPNLAGQRVGSPITVSLKGHIHSQHADGHTVMHVAAVKPDTNAMTDKANPGRKTPSDSGAIVTTQESHVP